MRTNTGLILRLAGAAVALGFLTAPAGAVLLNLVHEFDGNVGPVSYGTIDLTQNGSSVDVVITADTVALGGGDIHEWYFNLPGSVDANTISVSNEGGVSSHTIGTFSSLGANPSVAGGAGASFDAGVSFGNGGGPPGNGVLTTASFTMSASGGLTVADLLAELSNPNNTPPVEMAVHFQSTGIFNATSETIGTPEPAAAALLGLGGLALLRRRS